MEVCFCVCSCWTGLGVGELVEAVEAGAAARLEAGAVARLEAQARARQLHHGRVEIVIKKILL